jgi:hypothetical protein
VHPHMTQRAADALFMRSGDLFVPTVAALGPWSSQALHGGAVAALLASRLTVPDRTLARLTVELLAPVPLAPLDLSVGESSGGFRVKRQEAALSHNGRVVAIGRSLTVRRAELDLPPASLEHSSPFDPAEAPPLDHPRSEAADAVGWPYFDSLAAAVKVVSRAEGAGWRQWARLLLPVVDGTEVTWVETAVVAADFAQFAAGARLPYRDWTFLNSELTVHLAREPASPWVGIHCDAVVQPTGTGFNVAEIYDSLGRFGRSASTIVVDRRSTG